MVPAVLRCSTLFQFTPLREGRRDQSWGNMIKVQIFQFTPLREGRRLVPAVLRCSTLFQFTPLREGRRYFRAATAKLTKFQFTPLREGRRNHKRKPPVRILFQFTPLREGRQQKGTKKENDYCTFCRKKRKVYLIIKRIRKNHQNPTAHIVQKFTPTLRRHAG